MAMDMLRSCYTTTMVVGVDGQQAPVQWFFCDPRAKVFPHMSRYGSLNWLPSPIPFTGPGEVLGAPRPWANGSYSTIPLGQSYLGLRRQFLHGWRNEDPTFDVQPDMIPVSCSPLSDPVFVLCGTCQILPKIWDVVLTGVTPSEVISIGCAAWNGTYQAVYQGGNSCTWIADLPPVEAYCDGVFRTLIGTVSVRFTTTPFSPFASVWTVVVFDGCAEYASYHLVGTWACLDANNFNDPVGNVPLENLVCLVPQTVQIFPG